MAMATAIRKRLLLVAATAGYQTKIFADVARLLGVEVSLATDRCHVLNDPWGDQAIPVRFEALEESAAALAHGRSFEGVVAVGDRPAYGSQFHDHKHIEGAKARPHDHEEVASRNRFRLIPELTILLASAYPEEVQTVIDVACFGVYNSHRAFQCKFLEAPCAYSRASKLASPLSQDQRWPRVP